jgi:hypothetical protein
VSTFCVEDAPHADVVSIYIWSSCQKKKKYTYDH